MTALTGLAEAVSIPHRVRENLHLATALRPFASPYLLVFCGRDLLIVLAFFVPLSTHRQMRSGFARSLAAESGFAYHQIKEQGPEAYTRFHQSKKWRTGAV
jgi:hypothetical protein